MIKIEVEEYCHQCPDFEAEIEKPDAIYINEEFVAYAGDTIIRCEHKQRCKNIESHIKSKYDRHDGYGGACYIGKCGENENIDKKE